MGMPGTMPPGISELNREATQAGNTPPSPSTVGESDERTHDAPTSTESVTLNTTQQNQALDLIDKYTQRWAPIRRRKIRQALRAREYFKGNQYISFDSENFSWWDPIEQLFDDDPDKEDLSVYRYVNNVFQMLALSFVAALSPQVPKTQYMPANAERLEDLATARAASTIQQIIERQNNMKDIQKQELLYLWTDGCYFSYQRFLVDEDRAGTHREPDYAMVPQELPDRFECPNCGATTPAAQMPSFAQPACMGDGATSKGCGAPLGPSQYFPSEPVMYPKIVGYKDIPNGMVAISIFGILNITGAPYANELYETPMLRCDVEADLGSVRTSYPEKWDELKTGDSAAGDTQIERMARQRVLNMMGGRNNLATDEMPTFSRTWIQPWAFASMEDKATAKWFKENFPSGMLVVHVGRVFLECRRSKMRDHWTWCGMIKGFGLNPPGVGDVVLDVQDRINDASNTVSEHMDRNACPPVLADGSAVDTRKLNNKPMLAGTITEVPRKGTNQNRPLKDFITQIQIAVDPHIYDYIDKLTLFAQLVSGVLPQIFGGSDPNVKTASGQRQQLNTALGRLGLFWDNVRDEHARKSGLCVRIAANSYTEDILNVVSEGSKEFRNQYVRVNDLSGDFHAYPEADQGFPQTYAEIQQRLQDMFMAGGKTPAAAMLMELMDEPVNQKIVGLYMLPPNMVLPGEADRVKCVRRINQLLQGRAKGLPGPMGQPVMLPSIMVDRRYDRPDLIVKVIRQWAVENPDMEQDNPDGWANVGAYYDMAEELMQLQAMEQQVRAAAAAGPPPGGGSEGGPPGKGKKPGSKPGGGLPPPPGAQPPMPEPTAQPG